MKEGVLYENQPRPAMRPFNEAETSPMETQEEEPNAPSAEAVPSPPLPSKETVQETTQEPREESPNESTIEPGTPVVQLQKRLDLIMPPEAKNWRKQYE